MNPDDPKLTAYALDELDELERQAIARTVNTSPDARREIQETQTMARLLRAGFAADLENPADATTKPLAANLSDIRDDPWFWTRARPLAIAAVLAVFAVIGLALFSSYQVRQQQIAQAGRRVADLASKSGAIDAEFEAAAPNLSYAIVRRFINDDGVLPPKDSVRIEEMINYFPYAYPEPAREQLFSLDIEVASCPWAGSHRLIRVGLKGRETANSEADTGEPPTRPRKIAREAKIQVEFNPAKVASYHLIGYEHDMPGKEGSNRAEIDLGEIDAGETVTAFFEVVPAGASENAAAVAPLDSRKNSAQKSNEMLTAKLRYKKPNDDTSELIQRSAADEGKQFSSASPDFKFAAAVAEFGLLLRESEFKGNGTLGAVLEWAEEGKGTDANGYRALFLELVRKAEALKKS